MTEKFTRREFLKLAGLTLAGVALGCEGAPQTANPSLPAKNLESATKLPTNEPLSPTCSPTETPNAAVTEVVEEEKLPQFLKVAYLKGDVAGETAIQTAVDLAENNSRALVNRLAVAVAQEVPQRAGVIAQDVYLTMTADRGLVALGLKEGKLILFPVAETERTLTSAQRAKVIKLKDGQNLFQTDDQFWVESGLADLAGGRELVSCNAEGQPLKSASLRYVLLFETKDLMNKEPSEMILAEVVALRPPQGKVAQEGVQRQLTSQGILLSIAEKSVVWDPFEGVFKGESDFLWKPAEPEKTAESGINREFGFYAPEWTIAREVVVDGIKMKITLGLTRSVIFRPLEPVKALEPAREDSFERIGKYHLQMCYENYKRNNPGNDGLSFEQYEELVRQGKGEITIAAVDLAKAQTISDSIKAREILKVSPKNVSIVFHEGSLPVTLNTLVGTYLAKDENGGLVIVTNFLKADEMKQVDDWGSQYDPTKGRGEVVTVKILDSMALVAITNNQLLLKGSYVGSGIECDWTPIKRYTDSFIRYLLSIEEMTLFWVKQ